MGLVALILAGVGLLLAVSPIGAGIAWLVLIPAIVLAIIALVKGKQPKWMPLTAVIVAPIAWIIAIAVAATAFSAGLSSAINDMPDTSTQAPAAGTTESAAPTVADGTKEGDATIGQTVTNNKGVAVTFTAVTCGLAQAGPEFLVETAKGQFCEVKYSVNNGSKDKISLFSSDVTGLIGDLTYDADGTVSTFGGDYFTTDLNPGLATDAVVYIDIPADKALNYVVFHPQFGIFTDEIRVKVA